MKQLLCFLVLTFFVVVSCRKKELKRPGQTPILAIDKANILLGSEINAADTILVTENISWTASTTATWLKIQPKHIAGQPDTLIITALEHNIPGSSRTASVTLSPVNNTSVPSITITVTQQKVGVPIITWSKLFGGASFDIAYGIAKTTDGGYIITGYSGSNDGDVSDNHGQDDALVLKMDANGNKQWSKLLGGAGFDMGNTVIPTTDGGYAIAGYSLSNDGDVSGSNGGPDAWVIKLDASGNKQWSKLFGGNGSDMAFSIVETADRGFLVASGTVSNDGDVSGNHGAEDAWLIKLDANGNKQWSKLYGGALGDDFFTMIATPDGGYIIGGSSSSNNGDLTGNQGEEDAWLLKLDANGNKQWSKLYGGLQRDRVHAIHATTDGGYVIAGAYESKGGDVSGNHGIVDAWVMKVDANGNKQWGKLYGGTEYDEATSILPTADGGYIIAGQSHSNNGDVSGNHGVSDTWVMKLDTKGNKLWSKLYGGSLGDYALALVAATDGGYVIAGQAYSNNGDVSGSHGFWEAWVMKIKVQ